MTYSKSEIEEKKSQTEFPKKTWFEIFQKNESKISLNNKKLNYVNSERSPYICKHCGKKFSTVIRCQKHMITKICLKQKRKKIEKMKNNMVICTRCKDIFSKKTIQKHDKLKCTHHSYEETLEKLEKKSIKSIKTTLIKFKARKEFILNEIEKKNKIKKSPFQKLKIKISNQEKNNNLFNKPPEIKMSNDVESLKKQLSELKKWSQNAWEIIDNSFNKGFNMRQKNNLLNICPSSDEEISQIIDDEDQKKWDQLISPGEMGNNNGNNNNNNNNNNIDNNTINDSNKEYLNLLKKNKKLLPLNSILRGVWDPNRYHLEPVRHYADHYKRGQIIRSMLCADFIISLIKNHFFPRASSSFEKNAYLSFKNSKKIWLKTRKGWIYLDSSIAIKNMIFHTVSAYKDLIRREKDYIGDRYLERWGSQIHYLENTYNEKYRYVTQIILSQLPVLRESHPRDLEIKELKMDGKNNKIESKLLLKAIEKKRFDLKLKKAKKLHSVVIEYFESISEYSDE